MEPFASSPTGSTSLPPSPPAEKATTLPISDLAVQHPALRTLEPLPRLRLMRVKPSRTQKYQRIGTAVIALLCWQLFAIAAPTLNRPICDGHHIGNQPFRDGHHIGRPNLGT